MKNNKNFKKFAVYQLFFNIAVMFASPFFAIYMLQDLKFSYSYYIMVTMSTTVFYLIFTPFIGRFSDRYGNLKLLYVANAFFVFSPLAWVFIKNPYVLVFVPQLIAGLANAALVLAVTNFSYDSLKEEERGVGVAYLNVLSGIGVFVGSLIGGAILDYVGIVFMNKFLFIFIIAAVLRAIVAIVFLPGLVEQKRVEHIHSMAFVEGPIRNIHSEIRGFVFYLQKREAEGLKVFTPLNSNVVRKKG